MLETDRAGDYTFVGATGERSAVTIEALPAPVTIDTEWTLELPQGTGAPRQMAWPRLISWTDHDDPAVRYFSGTARYVTRFSVPPDWKLASKDPKRHRVYLDLGALWSIGEVWMNGQSLGIVWTDPFRIDCTDALRAGGNELIVEVTNTWQNRLVGDAALPAGQRVTRTNVVTSGGTPWSELEPIRSGLFGPVTLTIVSRAKIPTR